MTVDTGIAAQQLPPEVEPAPTRSSGGRSFAICVVVVYVLLGVIAFWPLLPWSSQRLFGPSQYLLIPQDADQITWFLAWMPYALGHGLDPFFSHSLFSPTGVNLGQNTAAPLLGLLTAPLAPFVGPIGRANFLDVPGHARVGDRRIRGLAPVEGVGSGGRHRRTHLRILHLCRW